MLTANQKTALAAHIAASPDLNEIPNTYDGAYEIAARLALPADPAFIVWRSSVTQDEVMQNGFDWTLVDNLTIGRARIWEWLFDNSGSAINPSKVNVRAGIDACWRGTAQMLAQQAVILGHCKRQASRVEALFATGTGSDAAPATMGYEGTVSYNDVYEARNA